MALWAHCVKAKGLRSYLLENCTMDGMNQEEKGDEFLGNFCEKVFALHKSIRFVSAVSQKGKFLAMKKRPEVLADVSMESLEDFAHAWIFQLLVMTAYEEVTGPLDYYLLKFRKLQGAAVPLQRDGPDRMFMMMSFDLGCDPREIIEGEIVPLVEKNSEFFM